MTNPENETIDVAEQQAWLMQHKKDLDIGWTPLSLRVGIPHGTLSQFGPGKYPGDDERVARDVFRYRQNLVMQAELAAELPETPLFFQMPTGRRVESLLAYAQRGRITAFVGAPGTGKTKSIEHYAAASSNVWHATMKQSTAGLNPMQAEVLAALGVPNASGTPQKLSRQICDLIRNTKGLLVIDEAQICSEKSLDEVRSWYDKTGTGIALLGDERLLERIDRGSKAKAYAQLSSRIGMRHVQLAPLPEDADALSDAWDISEPKQRAFIRDIASKPGGLRQCTQTLEIATMLASMERQPLTLAFISDAWAQLRLRQAA